MLDCYIADDNQSMIKLLSDYIQDTPNLKLITATTDPMEMAATIGQVKVPSIAFLDIDMPNITGLQLAALTNSTTAVIFITGHPQHAVDAFSKGAYDYLIKPFSYLRFIEAVNKVRNRLSALFSLPLVPEDHCFVYNKYGDLIKIYYADIGNTNKFDPHWPILN
jgi:DNA-binding LytR/AlgR family response regulator